MKYAFYERSRILIVKKLNLNFHPFDVLSSYRDPQLQVSKIVFSIFVQLGSQSMSIFVIHGLFLLQFSLILGQTEKVKTAL